MALDPSGRVFPLEIGRGLSMGLGRTRLSCLRRFHNKGTSSILGSGCPVARKLKRLTGPFLKFQKEGAMAGKVRVW